MGIAGKLRSFDKKFNVNTWKHPISSDSVECEDKTVPIAIFKRPTHWTVLVSSNRLLTI